MFDDHYMLVVYDDYYVLVNMMFQWFSSLITGNWIVVTDEAMMTPIPFVCLALPSSSSSFCCYRKGPLFLLSASENPNPRTLPHCYCVALSSSLIPISMSTDK